MAKSYRANVEGTWLAIWDESTYHLEGLRLWRDITTADLANLATDTYRQRFYPFVVPYLLAFSMLIGGPSLESSRLAAMLAGTIGWGSSLALAAALAPTRKLAAMTVCGSILLLSPGFFFYSSRALTEIFVLAQSTLCLLAAVHFQKTGRVFPAAAAGMLVSIAFLAKYNAGLVLGATLVLGVAVPAVAQNFSGGFSALRKAAVNPWLAATLTAAVPVVAWLAAPGLRDVYYYLLTHGGVPFTRAEHLSFVPTVLLRDLTLHPVIAIFVILAFGYWLVYGWKDPLVRIPLIWAFIFLVGITLHSTKEPRYVAPAMGVLAALAGCFVAQMLSTIERLPALSACAPLLAVCIGLPAMPDAVTAIRLRGDTAARASQEAAVAGIISSLRPHVDSGRPFLITGYFTNLKLFAHELWNPRLANEPRIDGLLCPNSAGSARETAAAYEREFQNYLALNPTSLFVSIHVNESSSFRGRIFQACCEWQQSYSVVLAQHPLLERVSTADVGEGVTIVISKLKEAPVVTATLGARPE